jgi:hypothetical protein
MKEVLAQIDAVGGLDMRMTEVTRLDGLSITMRSIFLMCSGTEQFEKWF